MNSSRRQRGVVLVVVLIIVALVAIVATGTLARVGLDARRSANLRDAARARYFVLGAEQLGLGILQESLKVPSAKGGKNNVNLSQPWARKGMVFPIEGGTLSGAIRDMSACFNLNSLLSQKGGQGHKEDAGSPAINQPSLRLVQNDQTPLPGQLVLEELLRHILPPDADITPRALAARIRDWLDADSEPFGSDGAEDATYLSLTPPYRAGNTAFGSVEELRAIYGMTPAIFNRIRPYLCALPDPEMRTINLNTIDAKQPEFLLALYEGMTLAQATNLLANRPPDGFQEDEFLQQLGNGVKVRSAAEGMPAFTSDRFQIEAEAVVDRGRAQLQSLVVQGKGGRFQVLTRRFINQR